MSYIHIREAANRDYNDPGETIIAHQDIRKLVPHHFVLTEAHRQTEGEHAEIYVYLLLKLYFPLLGPT
jgi:hypothetical protein